MPASKSSGKTFRRLLELSLALLLAACASGGGVQGDQPLTPAASVDLDRYLGRWYVIANIPYFAERGKVAPYVEYSRREDGRLNDFYFAQDNFSAPVEKLEGIGVVKDTVSNAVWEVSFFRPIWADYVILYVDPEYRYAVIGHPSRDYGWIFSRESRMTDERYAELLGVLEANGYDTQRVLKIKQIPDQEGAPGFQ